MKYEITVKEVTERERYPTKVDVYTQTVDKVNLVAVINAVNNSNIPVK